MGMRTLPVSVPALLGSVVFHLLLTGILLANSMPASSTAGVTRNERVIQAYLHRNSSTDSGMPDTPVEASSVPVPSFPAGSNGEREDPAGAMLTAGILLPPFEPPYIPASELAIRPQPQEPIVIPFPEAQLDKPKVAAVLVLFIGADGRIDRIELEESDMPVSFENAAIDTFLHAKMNPGIKDGRNTRARMRVLVEFEAR